MSFRRLAAFLVLSVPLVLSGCNKSLLEKSSNPLSPVIAGAIGGVTFTNATSVQPAQNAVIKYVDQPVTFAFDAPTSSGPRPFTLRLQVSTSYGFEATVFDKGGLEMPASGTRISLRMADRLGPAVYFWRVRAEDGANNSDWSAPASFQTLDRVVIGTPTQASPVGGARVGSRQPELTVINSASSGPHHNIQYQYQVSTDATFPTTVADFVAFEGGGQTIGVVPVALNYDSTYYWRARAGDGETISGWTQAAAFKTPLTPVVVPPPPPPPGGGGVGGDWQSCSQYGKDYEAVIQCVHAVVQPGSSLTRAFEVTKRVAWIFRGEGMGLLIKNGGENIIGWNGYSFSVGRVCYPDGKIWKIMSDVGEGGANSPSWQDNGYVDPSLYVAAMDPGGAPEPEALLSLSGVQLPSLLDVSPAESARRWFMTAMGLAH
jgi:hypothetical protein